MPRAQLINNASTTLASGINDSVTSMSVATGAGALFPVVTSYFYCTLSEGALIEIVKVTARTADTFGTIVRAQEGTTAQAFSAGALVRLNLTAAVIAELATPSDILATPLDTLAACTDITTRNASTTAHGLALKATAPAAGSLNFLGIGYGETVYSMKSMPVLGANVATALGVAIGTAGAPVVNGGALGTPASGTLTNTTGLPAAGVVGTAMVGGGLTGDMNAYGLLTANPSAYANDSTSNLPVSPSGTSQWWNTLTMGIGTRTTQIASQALSTGAGAAPQNATYIRSKHDTTWSAWFQLWTAASLPLGTGIAAALAVNVGSAGAPVVFNGALGTPSSGTVTNLTGTASINTNGAHNGTLGATTPAAAAVTTLEAGITTIGGSNWAAPATSGSNGADMAARINVGGHGEAIDFGTQASATWMQSRSGTNYATNYDLRINPNGGKVGVGAGTMALAATFQVGNGTDWNQALQVYGGSGVYTRLDGNQLSTSYSTLYLNAAGNVDISGAAYTTTVLGALASGAHTVTGALSATTTGKVGTTLGVGGATPAASGSGVTFPATQSASTDANTLDDYDEYTAASAACIGALTDAAVWKLTKAGNMVTLTLPGMIGTVPAGTYSFLTYGTPIPAKYRPSANHSGHAIITDNNSSLAASGTVLVQSSDGYIKLFKDLTTTATFTAAQSAGLTTETSVSWTI